MNVIISVTPLSTAIKFKPHVNNIGIEGTFQISNLGSSFHFMIENGKLHAIFFKQYFLHSIK